MTTEPTGAIDMHNYEQNAHLPECECFGLSENAAWQTDCQCDRLRACEARVVSTGAGAAADIEFGRQEGLREARDAVAALDHYRVLECDPGLMLGKRDDPDPWSQGYLVYSDDALAAIDALGVSDG